MSIEFTSSLEKPSNITALPSRLTRPAFGALYGFDAETPSTPPPADGDFNIATRDTESNILASTPTNPAGEVTVAYGTDTNNLYVYDGYVWITYFNNFTI